MTIHRFPEVQKALQDYYRRIKEHEKLLENQEHDIIQPFTSCRNSAYMFADIYAMYTNIDGKQTISANLTEEDVIVRLKYMLFDLVFVPFMSTTEYYAIKLGQKDEQSEAYKMIIKSKDPRSVKFSELIKKLPQIKDNQELWNFAISLRNDYVHYDGYARNSMTCPIKGITITMKEGERSGCTFSSLIELISELENSFFSFTNSLYHS